MTVNYIRIFMRKSGWLFDILAVWWSLRAYLFINMRKIKKLSQCKSFFFGVPGGIRTPDRSVRSRELYPAEPQVHLVLFNFNNNPTRGDAWSVAKSSNQLSHMNIKSLVYFNIPNDICQLSFSWKKYKPHRILWGL